MENLGRFYSSPGMVSESFTLFKATNLTKTGPGGGTPDENIAVHRVPLENISDYIDARRGEGMALDVKLLLILACSFRSEEHTSELQSLMRISYAVFCLKKKNTHKVPLTAKYHRIKIKKGIDR